MASNNNAGNNQGGNRGNNQSGNSGNSNRGFASMDPQKQREIAAEGGRAAHASGNAHEFTPEEAREAGRMSHKNDGNQQSGNNSSGGRSGGSQQSGNNAGNQGGGNNNGGHGARR